MQLCLDQGCSLTAIRVKYFFCFSDRENEKRRVQRTKGMNPYLGVERRGEGEKMEKKDVWKKGSVYGTIGLFHYDVTSKEFIVLMLRIMVSRGG